MNAFFGPGSFGRFFKGAGGSALVASSEWTFNETAATHADSKGVLSMTSSGTSITRDGQKVAYTTSGGGGKIVADANTYWDAGTFTLALWYTPNATTAGHGFLSMIPGNGGEGSYSLSMPDTGSGFSAYHWSGGVGSGQHFVATGTVTTGTKYLIIMKYKRVGGANDNELTLKWKESGGSTWKSNTTTTARLLDRNSAWKFNTCWDGTTSWSLTGQYWRLLFYNNTITTDAQDDEIFAAGSE